MKYKLPLIFLGVLFCYNCQLGATGPSYIRSVIKPISVNKKGDVLCRTYFLSNGSGGHSVQCPKYGLCVLTGDTILEFVTDTLSFVESPDRDIYESNYRLYQKQEKYLDSVFNSEYNPKKLPDKDMSPGIMVFGFKEANVRQFERNDSISLRELSEKKGVDLSSFCQKALYGAKGCFEDSCMVKVLYDFGNIVITDNKDLSGCAGSEYNVGILFDYYNPWYGQDIGYDCSTVTGVLFVPQK